MRKPDRTQSKSISSAYVLAFTFFLSAFEAGAAIGLILSIPADIKNAVVLGLSAQRLVLIAILVVGMLASMIAGLLFAKRRDQLSIWIDQTLADGFLKNAAFPSLILFFFATLAAAFTPAYQLGRIQAYFERLQPFLVWIFLAVFQVLLALNILWRNRSLSGSEKSSLRSVLVFLAGFLVVWILMGTTGLGLKPDNVHWNDAGAPVLMGQIVLATLAGLAVDLIDRWIKRRTGVENRSEKWVDIILFILIWVTAAFIWIKQPLPHSFFAPGPYPPNFEPYPFSDASGYDLGAQFDMLGQGLMNKGYVDKPLYSGLLVLLHVLAGQRYFPVVNLQAALIALFPALLYLCGMKLHSRGAGTAAAFLVIFREINSIGATLWILSSSTKVMMSEPLTMLGIVFLTFFLIVWGRSPRREMHWLAAAGGALGLTTLVRHNPWLLIPAVLAAILVMEWKKWRRILLGWLVFLVAFASAIAPWMIRNQLNNGKPFYFLVAFEGVVMAQRYETTLQIIPDATPTPDPSAPTPTPPAATPSESPADTRVGTSFTRLVDRVAKFVPAHFFHNVLVTSAIFPSTLSMEDLEHTIKEPGSLWDAAWTGRFNAGKAVVLFFFLVLLAIGLGSAWNRWRWAGILPGFIYICYNLATAVARTSGARYIQPADWAALFYLAVGLLQLWNWLRGYLLSPNETTNAEKLPDTKINKLNPTKIIIACAVAFSISGMVTLSEYLFPLRFPLATKEKLAAELVEKGWADAIGLDAAGLESFLENDQAVLIQGRALYPRYFGIDEGEPDRFSPYQSRGYPRLVITTIGQEDVQFGVFPLEKYPEYFPNGADVILLGCKGENAINLAAIIITDPREQVIVRTPVSPVECPLAEPVCDDNRQCH